MKVALVAAMSPNRVIGRDGAVPWHLPDDLAHFKRLTMGHPVIMGRRTYESLGAPLPGRPTIVLTRRAEWSADGVRTARSLAEALDLAGDAETVFIAGGQKVYEEALPRADRIELTLVHADVQGDTFFPELDESQWRLVGETHHPPDERHEHAMTFRTYEKRT